MTVRRASGLARTPVLAGVTVLLAMAGMAGCAGTPTGQHGRASRTTDAAARAVTRQFGPTPGTKAEAEEFAASQLAAIVLPGGAKRLPQSTVPAALFEGFATTVDGGPSVSEFRLWSLPVTVLAAGSFLRAHLPVGAVSDGTSYSLADPGAGESMLVHATRVPDGLGTSELEYSIVPNPAGGTLLRVNAQVFWYPAKPTAEDFIPASFRAVTLGDSVDGGYSGTSFTARRIVTEVVSLVDQMHVAEPSWSCTMVTLSIVLHPVSARQPTVYLSGYGCGVFFVRVGGQREPPLGLSMSLVILGSRLLASSASAAGR
jgi:hypothetical protein